MELCVWGHEARAARLAVWDGAGEIGPVYIIIPAAPPVPLLLGMPMAAIHRLGVLKELLRIHPVGGVVIPAPVLSLGIYGVRRYSLRHLPAGRPNT